MATPVVATSAILGPQWCPVGTTGVRRIHPQIGHDGAGIASMVSGRNDRSQPERGGRVPVTPVASMVSGRNDRSQGFFGVRGSRILFGCLNGVRSERPESAAIAALMVSPQTASMVSGRNDRSQPGPVRCAVRGGGRASMVSGRNDHAGLNGVRSERPESAASNTSIDAGEWCLNGVRSERPESGSIAQALIRTSIIPS